MKQSIILILIIIKSNLIFSQKSIMPNENTDFCPLVNTTFTITIPLIKPNSTVTLSAIGTPTIITGVTGLSSNATSTTFTFIGRFSDDNNTQSFRVDFTKSDNSSDFYISEFINDIIEVDNYYTKRCNRKDWAMRHYKHTS